MLVSALGDGMAMVAVAWLALTLAPPEQAGVWTGLAVAAYTLPATLGTAVLGRPLGRLAGVRLVAIDASLRAVALGVVAVLGGLGAGLLRHLPLWAVVIGIIVGWGIALLPLGLTDAVAPALVAFALGGLIYGPFTATSMALVQRISPPAVLSRVLATRAALTQPSTALGTLLGGPLVAAAGGRRALLISALLTIAFGALTAVAVAGSRRRSGVRD